MAGDRDGRRRPLLVELVGAPGAGKSTVFARLLEQDPRIRTMPILRRRPATAVRLGAHLAAVSALAARRRVLGAGWTRDGLVDMAYLRALPPVLRQEHAADVIAFDQGPIYTLTRPALRDPRLARWTEARYSQWRGLLDLVVWLDAPDEVLVARIDGRAKDHRLKGVPASEVRASLAADREVFSTALDRMGGGSGGPQILRLDTSLHSPGALAAAIVAALPRR